MSLREMYRDSEGSDPPFPRIRTATKSSIEANVVTATDEKQENPVPEDHEETP